MISFGLSEDQKMVQEMVRKFAEGELRPRHRELEKKGVPDELQKRFDELGLGLVDAPEELGGMGLGAFTAAVVHEELAWGDPGAAVALWAPHFAVAALLELGDAEQAKRWLGKLGRGAVAWSEPPKGPAEGFRTTAKRDGDGWVLEGEKIAVVNAGTAEVVVLFAQVEAGWDGVGAFVVDGTAVKGGAKSEWVGLETVRAGAISLAGVRVPDADRLKNVSVASMKRFFARAALVTAARQVGLARASYEYALEYTQDRHAFGKPVAHFQSISFTLAEMAMEVDAARWMVWRAAADFDRGAKDAESSVWKAATHANDAAWRVADNGVQLLGGAGFIQDYPVEKWMRDTKALALMGGSDQLAQLAVAGMALGQDLDVGLPAPWIQPVVT